MPLDQYPTLQRFFSLSIAETSESDDHSQVTQWVAQQNDSLRTQLALEWKDYLERDFDLEKLGIETNRWFSTREEAREWMLPLLQILQAKSSKEDQAVLDCNGTRLNEGDSVQVIKDLKVKGGSSDLKRGTMIKKIHLTSDPELVECRVDGSTLVLKTCFLKKS